MPSEIHKNDTNIEFRYTVKDEDENIVSLFGATTKQFIFKKPDGAILTKGGSFYTDGTDGILKYATVSGDLDVAGRWQSQLFLDFGESGNFHTDKIRFKVHDNI
jgi:hypothetical protein